MNSRELAEFLSQHHGELAWDGRHEFLARTRELEAEKTERRGSPPPLAGCGDVKRGPS